MKLNSIGNIYWFYPILFLLLMSVLIVCDGIYDSTNQNFGRVYYNSFENESDLAGWQSFSEMILVNDAPPNGGNYSVRISGGCVIPHASYTLPPAEKDIRVSIQCYGKKLLAGSTVELHIGEIYQNYIYILIKDSSWTYYKCDNSIMCPADCTLTIWMNSGGIVAGAMLIDMLEILEVK